MTWLTDESYKATLQAAGPAFRGNDKVSTKLTKAAILALKGDAQLAPKLQKVWYVSSRGIGTYQAGIELSKARPALEVEMGETSGDGMAAQMIAGASPLSSAVHQLTSFDRRDGRREHHSLHEWQNGLVTHCALWSGLLQTSELTIMQDHGIYGPGGYGDIPALDYLDESYATTEATIMALRREASTSMTMTTTRKSTRATTRKEMPTIPKSTKTTRIESPAVGHVPRNEMHKYSSRRPPLYPDHQRARQISDSGGLERDDLFRIDGVHLVVAEERR